MFGKFIKMPAVNGVGDAPLLREESLALLKKGIKINQIVSLMLKGLG